jgi:hypothetical protein
MRIVALMSDFGLHDWFVGSMKAAVCAVDEDIRSIDVTHDITPGHIAEGAFALQLAHRDFPPHTVFVAVVDPGVGSARGVLVVQAGDYVFVAPDNGLLSDICRQYPAHRAWCIDDQAIAAPSQRSTTFHGRDVFAPLGARLARGDRIERYGTPCTEYVTLPHRPVQKKGRCVYGSIRYIDRFGNCITGIRGTDLGPDTRDIVVCTQSLRVPIRACYAEVAPGRAVAVVSSGGFLEIASNGGSAAQECGLAVGTPVWTCPAEMDQPEKGHTDSTAAQ